MRETGSNGPGESSMRHGSPGFAVTREMENALPCTWAGLDWAGLGWDPDRTAAAPA